MPNDTPDRDAFRNLIRAARRFLDQTKEQRELQGMEEYRDLKHATNEAMQANAKVPHIQEEKPSPVRSPGVNVTVIDASNGRRPPRPSRSRR